MSGGPDELRTGVLLLNHGAAPDTSEIPRFLENIFSDRDIIRFPGGAGLQAWVASRIARARTPKVAALYRFMGGGSPLLGYMRAQARLLADRLSGMPVLIGLRYHEPTIGGALDEAVRLGVGHLVVLPQYPQYSGTTVGSCEAELGRALEALPPRVRPSTAIVPAFGTDEEFVAFLAASIRRAAERIPAPRTLLFTAHSIPMSFVDAGDPYRQSVEAQAALVAEAAGFDEYEIGYQSRSGPVRWLGPETADVVSRCLDESRSNIVLAPLSFVQDHLETLVELDVEIAAQVLGAGGTFVRVRAPFCGPDFARITARLVNEGLPRGQRG